MYMYNYVYLHLCMSGLFTAFRNDVPKVHVHVHTCCPFVVCLDFQLMVYRSVCHVHVLFSCAHSEP